MGMGMTAGYAAPLGEHLGRGTHQLEDLGFGERRAETEALNLVATMRVQEPELFVGLDTFGHDDEVETVRKSDDRSHDGDAASLAVDALDEGPVDLDGVDRHLGQIGQSAESRPEVVDRTAHADGAQLVQAGDHLVDALHEHALCHLELQQRGVQTGSLQHSGHHLHHGLVRELPRGEVHRHRHGREALFLPALRLPAGNFEHPLPERGHETGLLRQGDEGPGRDETELRVAPTCQCLDTDDVSGRHGELRLVVHGEASAVHGGPQAVLEREAEPGPGAHGRVEDLVRVAARRLGLVHGGVGVLQKGVRVGAVPGRNRHSDAGLHGQLTARRH